MLPGITNVTNRARYYSFYPWLIWAFDKSGHTKYDDDFIERFRRADCLFTLIAERHAVTAGDAYEDHAAAMIGSDTLASVARALDSDGTVTLSQYTIRERTPDRYFANSLGGLGQYYLGVLRELRILDGDTKTGIRYTREVGQPIAERMDVGVNRKLFLGVVDADSVTAAQLAELHDFCPCRLTKNPGEQELLGELFFARGPFHDEEALPRRRSLQSLLHLSGLLSAEGQDLSELIFRGCSYAGSLPSGASWPVPESLAGSRNKWAIYARNELLSVAVQGLFHAVLDAYEASALRFDSSAQIVDWFLSQREALDALDQVGRQRTFSECVAQSAYWLPALSQWQQPAHEAQLAEEIVRLSRAPKSSENRTAIVAASLRTLIALASRQPGTDYQYGALVFDPGYFQYYPINLESFAFHGANTWSSLPMNDVLRWILIHWGVEWHLRVALRKLRAQSQSTFRIRPSDRGMEVIEVPPAVHTRPRINQALRILKDIGALEKTSSGGWQPSSFGIAMQELGDAP